MLLLERFHHDVDEVDVGVPHGRPDLVWGSAGGPRPPAVARLFLHLAVVLVHTLQQVGPA